MALRESAPQASPGDVAKAVAQICPPATIIRNSEGTVTGCRTCPPGTAFHGFFKNGVWGINRATTAHFTSPAFLDVLIEGGGCDPHSENFGGTYVYRMVAGSPKLLRYDPGLLTHPCRQVRLLDDRDFLVCEGEWGAQGYKSRFVYSAIFRPDGSAQRKFPFMTHDTVGRCGETLYGKPDGPTQRSQILSVKFPDLNGDGLPDLSITATLGRKLFSVSERKACTFPPANYVPSTIPAKTYRLDYVFDGRGFRPTPATRQDLRSFDKLPASR